jgi:hypothetical protein
MTVRKSLTMGKRRAHVPSVTFFLNSGSVGLPFEEGIFLISHENSPQSSVAIVVMRLDSTLGVNEKFSRGRRSNDVEKCEPIVYAGSLGWGSREAES